MTNIIIGGIVAAIAGLVSGILLTLWQDRRRRHAVELKIILDLLEEVTTNKTSLKEIRDKWRTYKDFEVSAYRTHKGKLAFLDKDTRTALGRACDAAVFLNAAMAERRESKSNDSSFPTGELEQALEQASVGLQTWLNLQRKAF